MRARACLVAVALLGVGCAQNAILELQIQLPAAPTGDTWFAQTQVRNADGHPFSIPWMGGDIESVPLEASPKWDCLSVESGNEAADLHVRVRFCRSADCLDLDDGTRRERWYRLEHPFYIGRRTYHQIQIDSVPLCDSGGGIDMCGSIGVCDANVCQCTTDAECSSARGEDLICEEGNCVGVVDRCRIEGCIEGVSTTFCSEETGMHFCETNDDIPRDDTVECDVP